MKLRNLLYIGVFGVSLAFGSHTFAYNTSKLELEITGLDQTYGTLMIALFDSQAGFKSETAAQSRKVVVSKDSAAVIFKGLVAGQYAIKVFHDQNQNGELDTNGMGIPSEPYGFSNNASDPFSAPEWEETKFSVSDAQVFHQINLD